MTAVWGFLLLYALALVWWVTKADKGDGPDA